nr:unnamed protein product [Callosobruchus chinensis]CAH7765450.1 unnamed protein product [Callosobruchus chinensis]
MEKGKRLLEKLNFATFAVTLGRLHSRMIQRTFEHSSGSGLEKGVLETGSQEESDSSTPQTRESSSAFGRYDNGKATSSSSAPTFGGLEDTG